MSKQNMAVRTTEYIILVLISCYVQGYTTKKKEESCFVEVGLTCLSVCLSFRRLRTVVDLIYALIYCILSLI